MSEFGISTDSDQRWATRRRTLPHCVSPVEPVALADVVVPVLELLAADAVVEAEPVAEPETEAEAEELLPPCPRPNP